MGNVKEEAAGAEARNHVRRDVAIIIVFALVVMGPQFLTRGLWAPDEPRYMEVAREMTATGDYLVPHLNGLPYPDKPPLWFWLAAALYKVGAGFNSGRLVAACASLGTLLLVYLLGRRMIPGAGALLAALITGTTLLFFGLSKAAIIDPLFGFLTTAAFAGAWFALREEKSSRAGWLTFYAACALAVLTKGPVGIAVPAVAVLAYAIFNRKHISAGGWIHAAGAALFLVIVAAWLIPAAIRGGEAYTRNILFGQQAYYTVNVTSHAQSPVFYFELLPAVLYPWIFFAVLAIAQGFKDWRTKGDRDAAFLVFWFFGVLVFFTVIPAKRERYLLPFVPAMGLLCARYFALAVRNGFPWPRLQRIVVHITAASFALTALACAALPLLARQLAPQIHADDPSALAMVSALMSREGAVVALAAAGALFSITVLMAWTRRRQPFSHKFVVMIVLGILALSPVIDTFVFFTLDPVKSDRQFVEEAAPYIRAADKSFLYIKHFDGVVNLYSGIAPIPVMRPDNERLREEELVREMKSPEKIAVIGQAKALRPMFDKLPPSVNVAVEEPIGPDGFILIRNWTDEGAAQP